MKKEKKKSKKQQAALWLAYLAVMVPANSAMAGWQSPQELAANTPVATSSSVSVMPPKFFQITHDDVAGAVAKSMQEQGFKENVKATLSPNGNNVLYSANHPLKLAIHNLQVNPDSHLWQAQAYIISNNSTEAVKPISGRYEAAIMVPVLTRQLDFGDVIEEGDITLRTVSERQLRKDTVTEPRDLIGQSPRRVISPGRSIRSTELSQPLVIRKGDAVNMSFTTPYMNIRATGTALEDGSKGTLIRVKNGKSDKAITARVAGPGRVEVNSEAL